MHKIRDRGIHVHDILNLLAPVPDTELAFLKLFCHFLLFFWILGRDVVHMFHETLNISETEQFRDEWLWRELLEIVQMLANTEEDDGGLGCRNSVRKDEREPRAQT